MFRSAALWRSAFPWPRRWFQIPTGTICSGPDERELKGLAQSLGVAPQIDFIGPKSGVELAETLNAHRVLVVPSRWAEPFGIVALEGIACGCVVVGSREGGLPDAIGPCGVTFPNGDAPALASSIRTTLTGGGCWDALRDGALAHLAKHSAHAVAAVYLELFHRSLR